MKLIFYIKENFFIIYHFKYLSFQLLAISTFIELFLFDFVTASIVFRLWFYVREDSSTEDRPDLNGVLLLDATWFLSFIYEINL